MPYTKSFLSVYILLKQYVPASCIIIIILPLLLKTRAGKLFL